MAKNKTCRICGKTYEVCRSYEDYSGAFHWQEVSCSQECGAEYLRRIMEARNPAPKKRTEKRIKAQEHEVVVAKAADEIISEPVAIAE